MQFNITKQLNIYNIPQHTSDHFKNLQCKSTEALWTAV